ncbi:MAG TPA: A24 family peptidase [Solirubrobacteraceae bacterium]|nr:A24 family peptidase [Solirubrobacteraceae bacterium]
MAGSVGLGAPIPARPAPERTPLGVPHPRAVAALAAALIAVAVVGLTPAHAVLATLAIVPLVYVTAVDIDRRLIPNVVVLPATLVVLLAQAVLFPDALLQCVASSLLAAVLLFAPRLLNTDSMGMGDVKLALLLGAALGWSALGALVLAFVFAFPVALSILIRGGGAARRATFAFGPFLAAGAIAVLLAPAFN